MVVFMLRGRREFDYAAYTYLGYPTHHLAKELEIELEEKDIYSGNALKTLSLAPYDGCAFPLARKVTIMLISVEDFIRHNDGPTNEPRTEANIGAFLADRIGYAHVDDITVPVELRLSKINDLVHIKCTVESVVGNIFQFIQLARQNSPMFCGGSSESAVSQRLSIKDAIPFPSLQCLRLKLDHPFDDDVLFGGNSATLECLEVGLGRTTIDMLRSFNVFTPTSHPRLQCVKIGHYGELVLSLPRTALTLWDAVTLVKSLPLLSDLYTSPPSIGQLPAGVTLAGLLAFIRANYAPMNARFRCWYLKFHMFGEDDQVVICVLVMALACPNFDYAVPSIGGRRSFMELLGKPIATDGFKRYAARLRRLLFNGWQIF
ncbi:hypothetical protein GGI17_005692 [Coemansia sp. S146]|nr:hypothetical protein GGI17_005692 [Coemansia sp. S146]